MYYVEFKDPVTHKYGNHISVNSLRKKMGMPEVYDITSKVEAERIVKLAIDKGLTPIKEVLDVNVSDYLRSFWDFENSTYIKLKNAKAGKRTGVTQYTAKRNESRIRQHIILDDANDFDQQGNRIGYYLPKELMASELTANHIKKLEESVILTKKLTLKTWLNILSAISVPIKEMVREGFIKKNPLDSYDRDSVPQTFSNVRALTEEEIVKICNYIIENFFKESGTMWVNHAFGILLATATGMRQGEIIALRSDDIIIDDGEKYAMIRVDEAFAKLDGIKTTKSGKTRYTFCDKRLAISLKEHCCNDPSGLVFQCTKGENVPMDAKPLWKRFEKILSEAKISKKTKDGTATFHSLRHYANTKIISVAGPNVADAIIGHESGGVMTQRYNQPDISIFKMYANQVGSLIPEDVLQKLSTIDEDTEDNCR